MSAAHVEEVWLDPATVHLTNHVLRRYMERRHGTISPHDAEVAIRSLLERVADQRPRIMVRPNRNPTRMFVGGELGWIVTADMATVITFYPITPRRKIPKPTTGMRSVS